MKSPKVVVYVKHYLTDQGIEYFVKEWFPQVKSVISKQDGYISIVYSQNMKEKDLIDIELQFKNDATLDAWIAVPIHDELIKHLTPLRSRTYWKAARTHESKADPDTLDWMTIDTPLHF